MPEELTIEQEDAILRAEMAQAESGTNDQDETEEEETDEPEVNADEPEETETVDESESEEEEPKPKKHKSNVPKILSERNRYKKEAEEAKRRIQELEESGISGDPEYLNAVVDRKIAERLEVQDFFARNPEASAHRAELDALREENPNLSYDRAYKFFLAETNPQALLDEQTRNKLGAAKYSTA